MKPLTMYMAIFLFAALFLLPIHIITQAPKFIIVIISGIMLTSLFGIIHSIISMPDKAKNETNEPVNENLIIYRISNNCNVSVYVKTEEQAQSIVDELNKNTSVFLWSYSKEKLTTDDAVTIIINKMQAAKKRWAPD